MNFRELLNRVCRATGNGTVDCAATELTDDNHVLISEFFNQFKEEIEGAHNWRALRQTVDASLSAGSDFAVLEGVPTNARVVRIHDARFGKLVPLVFDVTNASAPRPLWDMDLSLLQYQNIVQPQNGTEPVAFSLDPSGEDGVMRVRLYPRPSSDRTLRLIMTIPQAYLDVDDLDVEIKIPTRALVLGTIWYTLQERGEELGQSSMFTEERYRTALADEIGQDSSEAGEFELVPV